MRYSIFIQGVREFGWNPSKVVEAGSRGNTVTQLVSSIVDSEESDLFGYMQTNAKIGEKKEASISRTTPVRLLPAIALEPFGSDIEMLTNKYQADKIQSQANIANIENQRTLFRYTICVDLHRIGSEIDEIGTRISLMGQNAKPETDEEFKAYSNKIHSLDIGSDKKNKRVTQLLEIVGRLYRDIRGRREDLKPLFIIGGVYDTFNPFFENIVNVQWESKKPKIIEDSLKQQLEAHYMVVDLLGNEIARTVKQDTFIGVREGFFANITSDFKSIYSEQEPGEHVDSPEHVISKLKQEVETYYR